jgi:hypothetical protein
MYLSSNQEVYDYLIWLAQTLNARGRADLSELAVFAKAHAAMSTEFLGEARIALRRILKEESGALSQTERMDMEDVVHQLTAAINRWPQRAKSLLAGLDPGNP